MNQKVIGTLAVGAIALSWYSILFSGPSEEASFEKQLAEGADPTELLEATAAGGAVKAFSCDRIQFGLNANDDIYIKEIGDSTYVSNMNGFKAFRMGESSFYAKEIPMGEKGKRLEKTFKKCKKPTMLSKIDVKFLRS